MTCEISHAEHLPLLRISYLSLLVILFLIQTQFREENSLEKNRYLLGNQVRVTEEKELNTIPMCEHNLFLILFGKPRCITNYRPLDR